MDIFGPGRGAKNNILKEINRRFSQINANSIFFTAETQRAQRITFLFVGRRRQIKTDLQFKIFKTILNRRLAQTNANHIGVIP